MEGLCLALHPVFQLGTEPVLGTPWSITGLFISVVLQSEHVISKACGSDIETHFADGDAGA